MMQSRQERWQQRPRLLHSATTHPYSAAPPTKPAPTSNATPAAYIHMVQHLIEQCLLFSMDREECMEALRKHARLNPLITSIVWDEMVKTNTDFFLRYNMRTTRKPHEYPMTGQHTIAPATPSQPLKKLSCNAIQNTSVQR